MSRDLILLALSLMTWGVGEGMFFYFQPVYLKELGANPVTIGIVLGAAGLVMTLAHIPAGFLSDRVGRRPLLIISWVTGMLSAWIMALAQSLPIFVIGLLLYSVTAFVISPLNSYVTAARGNLSVGRALTIISASYNSGAILGPFIGGMIGDRFGLHAIYRISASIFIVSVLIIVNIRPQAVYKRPAEAVHHKFRIDPRYTLYLIIVFITMFATYLPQPLTPNFLQDFHNVSVEQLGKLGSIASIGVVVLSLSLGSLPAHLGFLLAQVCVGLFTLLIWQGNGMPWYVIGYFLMGGYRAARVLAAAQTRKLVDQAYMGLAYGITETVATSSVIIAPPIAGYLYDLKPTLIYGISIILIGASFVTSLLFNPSRSMSQIETGDIG
jgi:MFS family permease